ncbi:hypothetical protein [Paenibacillus assamensis]|uniref:hypothetical protein n=1 Tax=Paenibacillus assamensis TaxID=311244 RepID=UPI00040AAC8D|nr:hypothetical protein [Paenibacillus assamensis]
MSGYKYLLLKDFRQSKTNFMLSFVVLLILQFGCFLLAHGVDPGLATVLSIFVTYLSAFILPILYIQSLQSEWKFHSVYYWINSSHAGYPVLLSKLIVAVLQTVLIMAISSATTLGIYAYEAYVIGRMDNISKSLKMLIVETYRLDAILLLYAIIISLGFGCLFLANKAVRYGAVPSILFLAAVLVVNIASILGRWFEWMSFRLPLGISLVNDSLRAEYTTYSLGGLLFLLVIAYTLLAVSSWLLKRKVQVFK